MFFLLQIMPKFYTRKNIAKFSKGVQVEIKQVVSKDIADKNCIDFNQKFRLTYNETDKVHNQIHTKYKCY